MDELSRRSMVLGVSAASLSGVAPMLPVKGEAIPGRLVGIMRSLDANKIYNVFVTTYRGIPKIHFIETTDEPGD